MRLKKRYATFVASLLLYGGCQFNFMQFRTAPEKQLQKLEEAGQPGAEFLTYEIDGREMHYAHVGHDSLPLLILVHGSPGSSDNMLDYLSDEQLLDKFQIAAVDRPGFGWSGFGEAEPSVGQQAADIQPIILRHTEGRAILLGHSYGGPVIARMAMDFPEEVGGLVIVAGSIDPELEPQKWIQKPADWKVFRWLLPPAVRACNQEILPLPEELEAMLPGWEKITCPVTVVQGMEDKLVHPGNADFAEKMLTNSRRVKVERLEGQDHFILWSHQDLIVNHVLELLDFLEK